MEAGSIPIVAIDKEYNDHPCKNAYLPFIKYNAPFVFLTDWKLLPKILTYYISNPSKVQSSSIIIHLCLLIDCSKGDCDAAKAKAVVSHIYGQCISAAECNGRSQKLLIV